MSEPEPQNQPTEIAGYRIDHVLGRGGMSVVYLGWNPTLSQWAALKVLPMELAGNPAIRARFQREGETTARLGHPNVVATYGAGRPLTASCGSQCSTSRAPTPRPPGQ